MLTHALSSPQVNHRMWSSQSPLRQFKGVPNDVLVRLEKKDLVRRGGGRRVLTHFLQSDCLAHSKGSLR